MLNRVDQKPSGSFQPSAGGSVFLESLEGRQLMSGSHHGFPGGGLFSGGGRGPGDEIEFSLAPAAVQTGLTSLAATDGATAPTADTEVRLGNLDGTETYSIRETGTGTRSTLTVDSTGAAVTPPTRSTTTYGAITNSAVTTELASIATALGLTAPVSTDRVQVKTAGNGTTIYTIGLTGTSSTRAHARSHTTAFSVDADGNVVGEARVPLSVLSTTIQNGLTGNAPSGATALTSASLIHVHTDTGVTLYTATYTATGTKTSVTVDAAGALHSGTMTTSTTYADLSSTVASEILSLATAQGVTTTIDSTTKVRVTTEANGTVLYTIRLTATSSTDSTVTYPVTITVDAAGNPTTLPAGGGGPGERGRGGRC